MKIMFALNDNNNDQLIVNKFEDLILQTFKDEEIGFRLDASYHCTDKHALLRIAKEASADLLIVNEGLPGDAPLIDILKEVRSIHPDMQIVLLLSSVRNPGDKFMSELVNLEIYDWLTPKWNAKDIYYLTKNPKRKKDVAEYIISKSSSENASYRYYEEELSDLNSEKKESSAPSYTPVLPSGLSDGMSKVYYIQSVPEVNEKPISYQSEEEGSAQAVEQAKPKVEKPVKEVVKPEEVEEIKAAVTDEPKIDETELAKLQDIKQEMKSERKIVRTPAQMREFKKRQEEEKPVEEQVVAEVKEVEEVKEAQKPVEEKVEEVKKEPVVEKADKFAKQPAAKPVKKDKKDKEVSLEISKGINRILMLRALPLTSYLAPSLLSLMKNVNKDTVHINLDKVEDDLRKDGVIYSSLKECEKVLPEHKRALVEVVAGNGLEKVVPFVDRIVLVAPQDVEVLKTFVSRYGELLKNKEVDLVIEKGIFGDAGVPQFKEVMDLSSVTIIRVTDDDKNNVLTTGEFKDVIKGKEYIEFESGRNIFEKLLQSLRGGE